MIGDLPLPALRTPLQRPTGAATAKFGPNYTLDAYKFAVAFTYRVNVFPDLWDPKSPPAKEVILAPARYQVDAARTGWLNDAPNILAVPTPSKKLKNIASLMLIPVRKVDGSLDFAQGALVAPWVTGVSATPAVASVYRSAQYGDMLQLRFKTTFDFVTGDTSGPKSVIPLTRDQTFWVVPNPDPAQKAAAPYVLTAWQSNAKEVYGKAAPFTAAPSPSAS